MQLTTTQVSTQPASTATITQYTTLGPSTVTRYVHDPANSHTIYSTVQTTNVVTQISTVPASSIYVTYTTTAQGQVSTVTLTYTQTTSTSPAARATTSSASFVRPAVALRSPTVIAGNTVSVASQVDDAKYTVTIPFAITVYDVASSTIGVSSNGILGLSAVTTDYANAVLPAYTINSVGVFPCWDDMIINVGAPQGIFYGVEGTAPNRAITFEWYCSQYNNVTFYYHFLVSFWENMPNVTTFDYLNMSNSGISATSGIEAQGHTFLIDVDLHFTTTPPPSNSAGTRASSNYTQDSQSPPSSAEVKKMKETAVHPNRKTNSERSSEDVLAEMQKHFLVLYPQLSDDIDVWDAYNLDQAEVGLDLTNPIVCQRISAAWSDLNSVERSGPDQNVLQDAMREKRDAHIEQCDQTLQWQSWNASEWFGSKNVVVRNIDVSPMERRQRERRETAARQTEAEGLAGVSGQGQGSRE
ncbi:hypothetical protein LTR56_001600 [Elasticomyces elasticus]|nr:hypothetical protein LTR56_001600 [Elasticomyces elasticus]KAK4932572.1 hypothetical protein LTR49_000996 [Elasticomyces elasticus]KAK5769594.1 hypothetical protein LTS12_000044 [Elasticomyces elasticus]